MRGRGHGLGTGPDLAATNYPIIKRPMGSVSPGVDLRPWGVGGGWWWGGGVGLWWVGGWEVVGGGMPQLLRFVIGRTPAATVEHGTHTKEVE